MRAKFVKQLFQNPREIGSVMPSSKFLAKKISDIAFSESDNGTTFLEFGPGTGVITKYLVKGLISKQKLIVLEKNIEFFNLIKKKYSTVNVIHASVSELDQILKQHEIDGKIVIVSSLPWISFSEHDREKCLKSIQALFECNVDTIMLQYSYSLKKPIEIPGLSVEQVAKVRLNFPPAKVWKYYAKK